METLKKDIFASPNERRALTRKKDMAKKIAPKKEYGDIKEKYPVSSFKK